MSTPHSLQATTTPPSYSPRPEPSPSAAERALEEKHANVYHELGDPVVQVETVITRTTIYSPRSSPGLVSAAEQTQKALDAAAYRHNERARTPTPTAPGNSSNVSSVVPQAHGRVVYALVDKALPRLPPAEGDSDENLLSTSAAAGSTSPRVRRDGDPSSAAFLAQAALQLGSPALGFTFDRTASLAPPAAQDGQLTPASSSTFTIRSSFESGPTPPSVSPRDTTSFDQRTRTTADKRRSMTVGPDQRPRKVTFLSNSDDVDNITSGSPSNSVSNSKASLSLSTESSTSSPSNLPRPRPPTQSRGLFRSRSMFVPGRAEASSPEPMQPIPTNASATHLNITPSATDGSPQTSHAPSDETAVNSTPSKRFWKTAFRAPTLGRSRRPSTRDGVTPPRTSTLERRYSVALNDDASSLPGPSSLSTFGTSPATGAAVPDMILVSEVGEIVPPPGAPSQRIRRIASSPRLAPPDEKVGRRRSMSLFHRGATRPATADAASPSPALPPPEVQVEPPQTPPRSPLRTFPPSQGAGGMFAPARPTLLRKLSKSLLSGPSSREALPPPLSTTLGAPSSSSSRKSSTVELEAKKEKEEALRSLSMDFVSSGEGPEEYLRRMMHSVNPVEIAGILAASKEPFFADALKVYMRRYNFREIPLDIALRRLLLETKLPHETQQIDRVLGAFAARYEDCNRRMFSAPDTAYVLAYSLVLLHSDVFNKANKTKMQKAAYVKNTRLPGVPPVILEYFYDNITAQPFKRATDHPEDFEPPTSPDSFTIPSSLSEKGITSPSASRVRKSDLYYYIEQNLLDTLRVNVEARIPIFPPFRAPFSMGFKNMLRAFGEGMEARHRSVPRRKSAPLVGANGRPEANESSVQSDQFRIVMASVLKRKEDLLLGNPRSTSRKWRTMTAVLTTSQLLFFRGTSMMTLINAHKTSGVPGVPLEFSIDPEDVVSLENAFSVQEHGVVDENCFRFVSPSKHQYVLQLDGAAEAEIWISLLNYASAFRTSGLQMRIRRSSVGATSEDTLTAQAASSMPRSGSEPLISRHSADHQSTRTWTPDLHASSSSLVHPRSAVTRSKLLEASSQAERARVALASEMRRVRNLGILTPLLKSTRDKIDAELEPLARRVKQLRLQIVRLECEHEILHADLVAFEHESVNPNIPAATAPAGDMLRLPTDTPPPSASVPLKEFTRNADLLDAPAPDGPEGRRPESSSGSFYSAVDEGT